MSIKKIHREEFEEILFSEFVEEENTEVALSNLDGEYIREVFEIIVSPITAYMDIYFRDGFYSLYAHDLINHEVEECNNRTYLRAEIKDQNVIVVWIKYKQ